MTTRLQPARESPYSLGFSPCPNDTFIFYALVHGLLDHGGLSFEPPRLADVETLNEWALTAKLDVTKISFHAFGHAMDDYVLLTAGSALGRGCGPLLVAGKQVDPAKLPDMRIAVPGRLTTASMLLSLFAPGCRNLQIMRFDKIMPAIVAGVVDAGVIIHESRFTYEQYGLLVLQDLGAWWENFSGYPIPLGGIAVRRSLGKEIVCSINDRVKASVRQAFSHPEAAMPYIKKHAQEIEDGVIRNHINLYVNPYTEELGDDGVSAVREFLRRGCGAGILPSRILDMQLTCDDL